MFRSTDIELEEQQEKKLSSLAVIKQKLKGEVNLQDLDVESQEVEYEVYEEPYNFKERLKVAARAGACEFTIATIYCSVIIPFIENDPKWFNEPYALLSLPAINFLTRMYDFDQMPSVLKYSMYAVRGFFFSVVDRSTIGPFWHEVGHYLLRKPFFSNADEDSININPSLTNPRFSTHYANSNLTETGNSIGENNSGILVSSAGVGFETFRNLISLLVAQAISKKHPELATYMRVRIIFNLLENFLYSISPYYSDCNEMKSNDFCHLEEKGVPPYVMTMFILGSMLFMQCMISCLPPLCNKLDSSLRDREEASGRENSNDDLLAENGRPCKSFRN